MRLAPLLAALLLAGCSTPASTRDDPPAGAPTGEGRAGIVLTDLSSAGCSYNDIIFVLPRSQVQAQLPEGFVARSLFHEATGGIVLNAIHCEEGWGWSAGDYFALVESVALPAEIETFDAANRTARVDGEGTLALDLYMLGIYTEHEELAALFARAGMTVEPARVSKAALPAPVGSAARGAVTDDAGDIVSYMVTGRDLGALTASHRQWRETPEGLLLIERFMSIDGAGLDVTQGAANCQVRPGSTIAEVVGGAPCSLGQDSTNGLAWEGRAYLFANVTAASFQNANA